MANRKARRSTAQQTTKPPTPVPAPSHRARVLGAGLVVYLGILAAMVVFDSYTFVLKGAVVPFLLVAAVLSHRFGGFVNDWAVFLGLVVLFDSLRSLVFAATTHFELPMYAGYAIAWERWLCAGAIAPVLAQQLRASLSNPHWLDRIFVLLHASHFLFFLLFGFVLWNLRRDAFRTYAAAMVGLLYLALLVQFLVPTIPPWLAAHDFMLLPPTERIMRAVYNVHLPSLVAVFDVNPIAAMPSLHAAMPALCALVALHYLGWAGLPVSVYAIGVWVGVIYLGEHYLVDVVAGVLLALVVYAGVRRWGAPPASVAVPDEPGSRGRLAPRPIVLALLLVAGAFGFGQLTTGWLGPLPITRAFVERELVDRSPGAHYLLGRIAFDEGDFARAQRAFTRAARELTGPAEQKVIRSFLGRSAHGAGDFPAAIAALEPLRPTTDQVVDLVGLALAYVEDKQYEHGVGVLREARQRFPVEPEPLYWLTRLQYLHGQITRVDVSHSIDALKTLPPEKSAPLYRSLSAMLDGTGAS